MRLPSNIDQIGSFKLGPAAHQQVRTALTIAKLMRRDGDGETEDVARAFRLMKGAALLDDDAWTELEVESDEDLDRQLDDYHDCVGVLLYALGKQDVALCSDKIEGEC